MSTEGNDPRGRGRRLFGSRRRQAEPAEPPAEITEPAAEESTPSVAPPAKPDELASETRW